MTMKVNPSSRTQKYYKCNPNRCHPNHPRSLHQPKNPFKSKNKIPRALIKQSGSKPNLPWLNHLPDLKKLLEARVHQQHQAIGAMHEVNRGQLKLRHQKSPGWPQKHSPCLDFLTSTNSTNYSTLDKRSLILASNSWEKCKPTINCLITSE